MTEGDAMELPDSLWPPCPFRLGDVVQDEFGQMGIVFATWRRGLDPSTWTVQVAHNDGPKMKFAKYLWPGHLRHYTAPETRNDGG